MLFNFEMTLWRRALHFAHEVCEAHSDFGDLKVVLDRYGSKRFASGSGGRVVCEFPDQLLCDGTKYFDEQHHETFFVLKACYRPNPQVGEFSRSWKSLEMRKQQTSKKVIKRLLGLLRGAGRGHLPSPPELRIHPFRHGDGRTRPR